MVYVSLGAYEVNFKVVGTSPRVRQKGLILEGRSSKRGDTRGWTKPLRKGGRKPRDGLGSVETSGCKGSSSD